MSVDTADLITGTYHSTITVEAEARVLGSPAQVPITLTVVDHIYQIYLPLVVKE